jgi:hypothetical protein
LLLLPLLLLVLVLLVLLMVLVLPLLLVPLLLLVLVLPRCCLRSLCRVDLYGPRPLLRGRRSPSPRLLRRSSRRPGLA